MRRTVITAVIAMMFVLVGCTPTSGGGDEDGGGSFNSSTNNYTPSCDNPVNDCDPGQDDDHDGISNGYEDCACMTDTDNDGIPDYLDVDSDGDGEPDKYEAVDENGAPKDSDGDGIPDFRDPDSDNDGVRDGDEDRNHDGKLGTCEDNSVPCGGPGMCEDPEAVCHPSKLICIDPVCLGGETDPTLADTDEDGVPDGQEPTFICNEGSEAHQGRKRVQYKSHPRGLFQIAIEEDAQYWPADPNSPGNSEGAAGFDMTDSDNEFAGFVVSRDAQAGTIYDEANLIISEIAGLGSGSTTISAGSFRLSHAMKEQVIGITLKLDMSGAVDPGILRNRIIATLLGRQLTDFSQLPNSPFLNSYSELAVMFMVQRFSDTRTVIMGGVAGYNNWHSKDNVFFHLSDAAGGTCLAETSDSVEPECEVYMYDVPTVDILWVIDDSGSMDDDQEKLQNATDAFLAKASAHQLNSRMCVVDMTKDNDGSCCTDTDESGDRWLVMSDSGDVQRFKNCVLDPAGDQSVDGGREMGLTQMQKGVERHEPPTQDSTQKYRPNATKVVIFMSDEMANEVDQTDMCPDYPDPDDPNVCHFFGGCLAQDPFGCSSVMRNQGLIMQCAQYRKMWEHSECEDVYRCVGSSTWESPQCDALIAPYIQFVQDHDLIVYALGVLETDPNDCSEGSTAPHGYKELIEATGGMLGSLCHSNESDFETTMEMMISDIAGMASNVILKHVPIPVSLAVALERKDPSDPTQTSFEVIPRSRTQGFEYRPSANRIVLLNQPLEFPPYEMVVSYERWVTDVIGPD